MKIQTKIQSAESASALIITLVLGVIMLVIMVSYLRLIGSQNGLVLRSESWNASPTMAEAGVEEALAQLNVSQNNNLSANGWGGAGVVFGPVTRSLSGGRYSVIISNASQPVIYSTGFVAVAVSGADVFRVVKATTLKQSLANIPVGVKKNINFNGNGVAVDSWNSYATNLSTGGAYDPLKAGTNASVASVGGAVNIGNHTIKGNLYLGPTASYSGGGTVTGNIYTDSNIGFPDVVLPPVTWQNAPLTVGIHLFTSSGYYTVSDQFPIDVAPGVKVTLNVTTAINYAPVSIQLHGGMTNSATAYVYLNGPTSFSIAGNTAIDASSRPQNLQFFGLPTLTSISFSGNSTFVGTLYAPQADATLNGGGNNSGWIGSIVTSSLTMGGHYQIHYDESLVTNSVQIVVVQSWQEL